jgi:hypothetical protein
MSAAMQMPLLAFLSNSKPRLPLPSGTGRETMMAHRDIAYARQYALKLISRANNRPRPTKRTCQLEAFSDFSILRQPSFV